MLDAILSVYSLARSYVSSSRLEKQACLCCDIPEHRSPWLLDFVDHRRTRQLVCHDRWPEK